MAKPNSIPLIGPKPHRKRRRHGDDGVEATALSGARSAEIALVTTDVDMLRLGGTAVARTLWRIRPEIELLAFSGSSPSESGGLSPWQTRI